MSLLDNLKGLGGGSPGYSGASAFNPFKLLGIGESMLHYSDGIRIKDYTFFGVLTSERFILIDNSPKGKGAIAKEMPADLIQKADLEHEGTTPVLILHVLIEGQIRHMRLMFTGLIESPEDEARAWYATINGHPLDTAKQALDSAQAEHAYSEDSKERTSAIYDDTAYPEPIEQAVAAHVYDDERKDAVSPPDEVKPRPKKQNFVADGIIDAEEEEERLAAAKITQSEPEELQPELPVKNIQAAAVPEQPVQQVHSFSPRTPVQIKKREVDPRRAVSIHVQKPKLTPLGRSVMEPNLPIASNDSSPLTTFCLMCGACIPAKSRFCRVCGEQQ